MTLRTYQNHTPTLGAGAFVDISAVVIGDVEIGTDSSVWPLTVIRGDMHRIRIGARTNVQDGTIIHVSHHSPYNKAGYPTLIGEGVTDLRCHHPERDYTNLIHLPGLTVSQPTAIGCGRQNMTLSSC